MELIRKTAGTGSFYTSISALERKIKYGCGFKDLFCCHFYPEHLGNDSQFDVAQYSSNGL